MSAADRVFLDTNIFIYAHDRGNQKKRDRARGLIFDAYGAGRAVISAQVLAEFFHVCTGKLKLPYVDALKELHFMSRAHVVEQSTALVVSAASIFDR